MPKASSARKAPAARRGNGAASKAAPFKLTYSTMFSPPETMHTRFERALAQVKANLGRDYGMLIGGQERYLESKFEDRSPIDTRWLLGTFQKGGQPEAHDALAAAAAAWPKWAGLKWKERVRLMRRVAQQIEKRVYEIGAVLSLEVGKNRMEGLGDAQETADLIAYA